MGTTTSRLTYTGGVLADWSLSGRDRNKINSLRLDGGDLPLTVPLKPTNNANTLTKHATDIYFRLR